MLNWRKQSIVAAFGLLPFCVAAQPMTPSKGEGLKTRFGKGIQFVAADSSMSVKMGVRFQTLFSAERSLEEGSPIEKELMIRRFRLKFDGFAFTPRLIYKIELALSNRDNAPVIPQGARGANIVLDAVLKYQVRNNLELWFGQTKLPGNRERVISSQALQFVDRSLVNAWYNLDRDLGVQLHHEFNLGNILIRDQYAVSLGQGRNITMADTGGLSYTARLEVLPFGEFTNGGDYFDADLEREESPKLSLAAGYSYNQGAMRNAGELGDFVSESRDLGTFFADAMFKYRGWSVTTEFMNKQSGASPVLADSSDFFQTGMGWNLQSGYLFKNNIELAARYSLIQPAEQLVAAGMADRIDEITLAASKYFLKHNLKIQTDLSHTRDLIRDEPTLRYRLQVELAL